MNSSTLINGLFIFMLAGFIGFEVIRRVSPLLHTPLMSLTNALDAIAVVGAIVLVGRAQEHAFRCLGDHCRSCGDEQHCGRLPDYGSHAQDVQVQPPGVQIMNEFAGSQHIIEIIYLVASALFILSLKWMSSPTTARHGVWAGSSACCWRSCGTLLHHGIVDYKWIAIALVLGTMIGVPSGPGADDRGAPANRSQPRVRSALRHSGRHGRILSAHARHLAVS